MYIFHYTAPSQQQYSDHYTPLWHTKCSPARVIPAPHACWHVLGRRVQNTTISLAPHSPASCHAMAHLFIHFAFSYYYVVENYLMTKMCINETINAIILCLARTYIHSIEFFKTADTNTYGHLKYST